MFVTTNFSSLFRLTESFAGSLTGMWVEKRGENNYRIAIGIQIGHNPQRIFIHLPVLLFLFCGLEAVEGYKAGQLFS